LKKPNAKSGIQFRLRVRTLSVTSRFPDNTHGGKLAVLPRTAGGLEMKEGWSPGRNVARRAFLEMAPKMRTDLRALKRV
jgi:hypothetical protein